METSPSIRLPGKLNNVQLTTGIGLRTGASNKSGGRDSHGNSDLHWRVLSLCYGRDEVIDWGILRSGKFMQVSVASLDATVKL